MSQTTRLNALKFCFRISRLERWRPTSVQKNIIRSYGLSSNRYYPFTDWFLRKKGEVPSAQVVPDSQELHGFVLKDDFNWLRESDSRDVNKYIKDENRYTEASLADTETFQRQLILEMNHWLPLCHELESIPERIDHHIYYFKSPPEGDRRLPVICRRIIFKSGLPGLPQIILNQNELAAKYPHVAVSNFKLSHSRQLAGFLLDSTGLETYSCHITKAWDGPLDILDIIPNAVNFEWGADDSTIFYTTHDDLKRSNKLWKHKLGEDVDKDILMYEETNERYFMDVSATKDRKYITVNSNAKATSEVSLISLQDQSVTHQPFYPRQEGTEYYVEHRGKEFFILTNAGGFNYRVVRVNESNPAKENWKDIVPDEPNVFIDDMEVFQNYCVVYERRLTSPRLSIISLDDPDDVHFVHLPPEVCSLLPGSNQMFKTDAFRFHVSSPIVPPQVIEYDMSTGTMQELHPVLSRKPKFSSSDYHCMRTEIPSKDGTMVPITLFHHRNVKKNGKNPMLLCVYGSQAVHEKSPHFKSMLIAGPRGVGKKMLIHCICTETGANMFDLTAANIAGKYPGKAGLAMMMHMVFKVARQLQPSVVYIGDAERTFVKKVPKTDKTDPKRLKKDLPKILKTLKPEDRVMIVGTSRQPFDAEVKPFCSAFQKIILIPRPDYASRYLLWRTLICKNGGRTSESMDLSSLAKITDGYTPGHMVQALQQVLTDRRIQQLSKRPLVAAEFVSPLARIDPIYKEEEEAFKTWYAKTPLGKKRAKAAAGDDDGDKKGKKGKKGKKSGKKKKK